MQPRAALMSLVIAVAIWPLSSLPADDSKPPAATAPDYSKYTNVLKEVNGEVVKADEGKLTVRVWTADKPAKNGPALVFGVQKEVTYSFIPESLVRRSVLPARLDEKGKNKPYSEKEKTALKLPKGSPGFAASISDLSPGSPVSLALVREKSSAAVNAKEDDLRIKFAVLKPETAFTRLQGVWYLDAIESTSKRTEYKDAKTMALTIRDEGWALSFGKDVVKDEQFLQSFGPANGNVNMALIFLDPTTEPKMITLRNPRGNVIWSGRYKLDGDALTICRPLRTSGAPATELKATDATILWAWRRSKDL